MNQFWFFKNHEIKESKMLATLFGRKKSEPPPAKREIKHPAPGVKPGDIPENRKKELPIISGYINELIRFFYHNCPLKMLAVPRFEYLTSLYYNLSTGNLVSESQRKEQKFEPIPDEKHWGEYTMNKAMINISPGDIPAKKICILELEGKGGAMFCQKLRFVIAKVVLTYNASYFFSDVRHLLYLKAHPCEVPEIMKNGKGNIFAGTTIMVGSVPHVPVAIWKGVGFWVELISLDMGLEDVAQFVMIRK